MPLTLIITDAGRAALINATATGTAPVTITEIGLSATAHTADPADTALPGEFKRIAGVGGMAIPPSTIHVSATDATADADTARSFVLYLSTGTLFAIYGQAAPIVEKTAVSMAALALDVVLVDVDIAALDFGDVFFSNPQATSEQMGISELATLAEARAGADEQRTLTPYTGKNSVLQWLAAIAGAGSGLDADLLDGQHGAWYADIAARLGYTPLNATQFTGAQILSRLLGVDGAGSGLDADTVDGLHASSFLTISSYMNTATYGYLILANGLKLQWRRGLLAPTNVNSFGITFPVAFSQHATCFLDWRQSGDGVPMVENLLDTTTKVGVELNTPVPLYSQYYLNLFAIGF